MQHSIRLERMSVDRLKPAPYNPRVDLKPGMPGYERLKRSLEEFDLVQPIVWNCRTGHVVSGHQRFNILKQEGATELEVVVVDLPLEREQALNVTLNNPNVGGSWDIDKLTDLLAELTELQDFDAELTGFDDNELKHFALEPDPGFSPDVQEDQQQSAYRISFEVPADDWEDFRPLLDRFLAEQNVQPHIRPPRRS